MLYRIEAEVEYKNGGNFEYTSRPLVMKIQLDQAKR